MKAKLKKLYILGLLVLILGEKVYGQEAPAIIFDDFLIDNQVSTSKKQMNLIRDIEVEQGRITIYGDLKKSKSSIELSNPNRIGLDIVDSSLHKDCPRFIDTNLGNISRIELSQYTSTDDFMGEDQVVRIIFHLRPNKDGLGMELIEDKGNIILRENSNFWKNLVFSGSKNSLEILGISQEDLTLDYDSSLRNLRIDLPKRKISLEPGLEKLNNPLVGQVEVLEDKDYFIINLSLRSPVDFKVENTSRGLNLLLKEVENKNNSQRLIVLDPGHGGHDGGANPNLLVEKDISLDIGLKLEEILNSKGYNTYLIRDRDVFIDRFERAKIANSLFPDVFVSIHCNSVVNNSQAQGIETYYYDKDLDPKLKKNRQNLAKSVQDKLIGETKAPNRGTKINSFTVIKNTNMPSILVETGFLTNPREEKLLASPDYRYKIALGISQGLDEYFKLEE